MKECPACHAELRDNAVSCPNCGGSYLPDGRFETCWEADMARMVAERERKVSRAEEFGKLGKPHPHFFLEEKSGGGCLVSVLALTLTFVALAAALVLVAR